MDPGCFDNVAIRWACENGHVDVVRVLLMDPRIDICRVVLGYPGLTIKYGKDEQVCVLLALGGIVPFCNRWGPLDPSAYSLDKLRQWQRASYFDLYEQDEEFRSGPYGVLLKDRLKVADLYGSGVLQLRLPTEMIDLVLEYTR